jgi:Zn-dependent protease
VPLVPGGVDRYAGVMRQIAYLQQKRTGWSATFLILFASAWVFILSGWKLYYWKLMLALVPILLFHELGHALAMRAFHYRNIRMFFIPLFGAAVTGRHYNVPGWKKAVVSLMGPIPGILLGAGLGVAAVIWEQPTLFAVASLAVFINGFNLLPVLPLDGGWTVHAILFCRHARLDLGFRIVTVLALFGGAIALRSWLLFAVGVLMLVAMPAVIRQLRIIRELRRKGVGAASSDSQTIAADDARPIIDQVRTQYRGRLSDRVTARMTLFVFETMNARPPGWLATAGLFAVQVTALAGAAALVYGYFPARSAALRDSLYERTEIPLSLSPENLRAWRGAQASSTSPWKTLFVATWADQAAASRAFDDLTSRLPPTSVAQLFGQSILLTVHSEDGAREKWEAELKKLSSNVQRDFGVPTAIGETCAIACDAPDEATATAIEEELIAFLDLGFRGHLRDPWSKTPPLTDAQIAARRTYGRLEKYRREYEAEMDGKKPVPRAAHESAEETKGRLAILHQRYREASKSALEKVRKQPAGTFDPAIVAFYEASHLAADADSIGYGEEGRKFGASMGQLPLEKDKAGRLVSPRFAVTGEAKRRSRHLRMMLILGDPQDSFAAFAEWLLAQGCSNLKYRILLKSTLQSEMLKQLDKQPGD